MFYTRSSQKVPGVSSALWGELLSSLERTYFISPLQISESASFSMAMVVRHALGAYAARSNVVALVTDSLSGAIAAATVRHLLNGGATATVMIASPPNSLSGFTKQQVESLLAMKVACLDISSPKAQSNSASVLADAHLIISGLFSLSSQAELNLDILIELLQELTAPIHSVHAPFGVNPDSAPAKQPQLFSASTLSLGLPLSGLHLAQDAVGRHYLCDICLPHQLLQAHQLELPPIFSEQPVIQIFREESTS